MSCSLANLVSDFTGSGVMACVKLPLYNDPYLDNYVSPMNIDRISEFILEPNHLLGAILLLVAAISMCVGKTITRGQGFVSRAEEPKTFWGIVGLSSLAGIVLVLRGR